jgi:hypothetical protein
MAFEESFSKKTLFDEEEFQKVYIMKRVRSRSIDLGF